MSDVRQERLQAPIAPARLKFFFSLAFSFVLVSWFWALYGVKPDREQGEVFRLLFLHVPAAWNAFFWFVFGAVISLVLLLRLSYRLENPQGSQLDHLVWSANLSGSIFALLTLLTGSFWARKTWGVWWYWDSRLTTTLILFLLGCVYHLFRSLIRDPLSKIVVPSFIILINALNVPVVYFSVQLWRSIHQPPTFFRQGQSLLVSKDIFYTLMLNSITLFFLGVFFVFLLKKYKELKQVLHHFDSKDQSVLEEFR
jgi:heme exporter protein C